MTSAYVPLSGSIIGEQVCKVLDEGNDKLGADRVTAGPIPAIRSAPRRPTPISTSSSARTWSATPATPAPISSSACTEAFDNHPLVGEVRGVGLMAALEFVATGPDRKTQFDPSLKIGAKVSAAALDEGMIARAMPHGDILGFAPPLVITRAEVDKVIDLTTRALDRVHAAL